MYAVLETGSKQYRVAAGDKLEIERLDVGPEGDMTAKFFRGLDASAGALSGGPEVQKKKGS